MEEAEVWKKERYGGRRGMTKKSFLGSLGIAGWKKERYRGRRGMGKERYGGRSGLGKKLWGRRSMGKERYGGRRGMKDGEVWRKKRFVEGEVLRKEVWRNER